MAKSLLKIEARKLRRKGRSILDIAQTLNIAKSTISRWCLDITLSEEQIENLIQSKNNAIKAYQLNGALSNRVKKLKKIEHYKKEGLIRFKKVTNKEFFTAGLALYLAEGRKNRRVTFTNSDPKIIKFMLKWFKCFFNKNPEELAFYVYINESHREREEVVQNYWINYLNVPSSQFRKTVFIKSKQKKIYENHNNHFGTLHCEVLKSSDLLYKISGLTEALLENAMLA